MNNPTRNENTQPWKTLYRIAGTAAAGVVLVMLAEILISFVPAGATLPETVIGWFELLQSRPFIGLRNLGLINVISILLGVPVALALYVLLRRTDRSYAALALASSLLGTAVFLATNRAFPMLALSHRYAVAATEIERAALVAAGQALLAVGASHTPGTFLGFLLGSVAGITNAALMVRSPTFPRATAYVGLAGTSLLLIFDSGVSFAPALWNPLMVVAMIGGLSSITWYGLVARDLWREAREISLRPYVRRADPAGGL
ncbi:MAG: DUF4386 family protein [Anaerolineales bacterium]